VAQRGLLKVLVAAVEMAELGRIILNVALLVNAEQMLLH
jgi:hypothetical protein